MKKNCSAWEMIALALLVIIFVLVVRCCDTASTPPGASVTVTTDTVTIHDTIVIHNPVAVNSVELPSRVRYLPLVYRRAGDTVRVTDTALVAVEVPREQRHYVDSSFEAWVSGYEPQLDSLRLMTARQTITREVVRRSEKPPNRWGLGIQAGGGWDGRALRPYVGIGISYNILTF